MKKVIGLVLLLVVLVAVSGCTQQTKTAPATTAAPTEVVTTVETPAETTVAAAPVETTAEVTMPAETTAVPAAEVTNATVAAPTATATVLASMTPSTKITVIHIANNSFSPATLMVLPGTGITWVNDDRTVHSVKVIGEHKGKFNSGDIAPTARWGYTFSEAEGTFEYTDGYNPNATGVIIVKKGESFYGQGTPTTLVTSTANW